MKRRKPASIPEKELPMLHLCHEIRVHVLERGSIIESCTHAQLLDEKGLYYAMWRQQIGEKRTTPVTAAPPRLALV